MSDASSGSAARDGEPLDLGRRWSLEDLAAVASASRPLRFGDAARRRVEAAHAMIASLATAGDDAPNVYGVNTGFGALAETRIDAAEITALQHNLLRSHACGVGPDLPAPVVRALLALRAQVLAFGCSGVRPELVEALLALLTRGVLPRVPAQGSVGASGDLAPLAHLALVLTGEGEADFEGERLAGGEALRRAGLAPLRLQAKEGLALINGTQLMLAQGGLALHAAFALCRSADVTGAMSLEALQGSAGPFDPRIQAMRPHPGQADVAANLRMLLAESEIMESHRDCAKVQDPYSLRCMPQVHGASRDMLAFARETLERETEAATDNPLVFPANHPPGAGGEPAILSGGNFHGQPLALALDAAAMAVAELGNVAERRLEQLVNPALSSGLPPFLGTRSGLDSGFMMAQVTAAALVSENKILSHPASVDSIPSSAGKEDHVSMGTISARKLTQVVEHVRTVLAIEAMVAAQGLDLRQPLRPARAVAAAHACLREAISPLEGDRALYPDIAAAERLLREGALVAAAERAVGALR
ncbi:MAG: histidine ammonia-lyase [Myxococcota bacterium]